MPARKTQRVINGFERDFQLHHDHAGAFEEIRGGIDIGGQEAVVSAFHYPNTILSGGFDEDGRDAAGDAGGEGNAARIDAARMEIGDGGGTKQVVADAGHHGHGGAAETRGDGLIGSFPAETEAELAPENGLTGTWNGVGVGDEIDVGAADNSDVGWPLHKLSFFHKKQT